MAKIHGRLQSLSFNSQSVGGIIDGSVSMNIAEIDTTDHDDSYRTYIPGRVDGTIDLGAIATEFLILGIDPYPRKPGIVFDAPRTGEASGHPFAALAALKKGQHGG